MLRRRAVPLVEVVLLGNGNGRDDMNEPPEQHGDLACETDVVHRSYGLYIRVDGVGMESSYVTCVKTHPPHPFLPRSCQWRPPCSFMRWSTLSDEIL